MAASARQATTALKVLQGVCGMIALQGNVGGGGGGADWWCGYDWVLMLI